MIQQNQLQKNKLLSHLECLAFEDYPVHSRAHPLKIGKQWGCDCFIKREDELGCLLSGSKVRKYRSLIAALKKRGCKKAGVIGSQFSNHVLGLSSLLLENAIEPTFFLLGNPATKEQNLVGNALFIQAFAENENVHLISRENWPNIQQITAQWQNEHCQFNACVIPEGGSIDDSLPGLVSLALDIVENERQLDIPFQNILIDSGSGLTAASLIAAFGFLNKEAHIHVLLAASTPHAFVQVLDSVKHALEKLTGTKINKMPQFTLHAPTTAKSFGSTNTQIFQTIVDTAKYEGVLLDPIYSCKLYLLLKELLETKSLTSPTLFIHSGGVFTLAGFQGQLAQTIASLL